MKYITLLALCAQILGAQTFQVKRLKRLWWDGAGQVEITQDGIAYNAKKPKHSRTWKYEDIQYFDRISPKEFVILSYEDIGWQLGRDREYHFVITSGELTDEVFQRIAHRLDKPVTDRVVGEVGGVEYEIPVKHLHTLGGCEGELIFTGNSIYYATKHKEDAREWLVARDVQSVWSMNPYELEIHVYDNNRREFSQSRIYKFALKRPLNAEFYRALKLRLYNLESAHLLMR
jgi:hypothetical protein